MFDAGYRDGDTTRARDVGSVPPRMSPDGLSRPQPSGDSTAEWLDVAATAHRLNNVLVTVCGLSGHPCWSKG
jgi:hypothetical protein